MSNAFRFVVHRARKHELSWCVPGFTARSTLKAALVLAGERSRAHPVYVHELRADGYHAVAKVELGRVTVLERAGTDRADEALS